MKLIEECHCWNDWTLHGMLTGWNITRFLFSPAIDHEIWILARLSSQIRILSDSVSSLFLSFFRGKLTLDGGWFFTRKMKRKEEGSKGRTIFWGKEGHFAHTNFTFSFTFLHVWVFSFNYYRVATFVGRIWLPGSRMSQASKYCADSSSSLFFFTFLLKYEDWFVLRKK